MILGKIPLSFSERYCVAYQKDMLNLQCRPPSEEPRVSQHIEQIKDMVTQVLFLLLCSIYLCEIFG